MEQNNVKINGCVENDGNEEEGLSSEDKSKREKVDCSHRVIEKRRRDRINSSLAQLSKLVPIDRLNKKNSGKLEKAEILEVTVRYLEQQQQQQQQQQEEQQQEKKQEEQAEIAANDKTTQEQNEKTGKSKENEMALFLRGFKQCVHDATKFFQDVEELDVSEGRCFRLIQHLKRQIIRYENREKDLVNVGKKERLVWDSSESSDVSNRRHCEDWNQLKRKNGGLDSASCKKARSSNEPNTKNESTSSGTEQDRSSCRSPSNSTTESVDSNSTSRNYMPFVFPNMPMFATLPFASSSNMPRFPSSSSHFPGYQYPQSAQYIPVALPQFPMMGMNFMPGFGMVNGEQSQNGSLANQPPTSVSMHSSASQSMPGLLPPSLANAFIPSMYTNGVHANIIAMRPRDSGYESSEKSASSSKESSETSPQSFSDDSCQSYVG